MADNLEHSLEITFPDPFNGPIKAHVPEKYWKHISEETPNSYIVATFESGKKLREVLPDANVIVRQFSAVIYQEVLENLTPAGKDVVEKVNPWLMVTLIDMDDFDKIICHKTSAESHHQNEQNSNQELDIEKKSPSPTEGPSQTDTWARAPTLLLLDECRKAKDLLDAGKLRKKTQFGEKYLKNCVTLG